jgi:hypothetical protein
MGSAVAATSMGPPGGDFGALFGSGAGGSTVDGWSWKPSGTGSVPAKKASKGWNWAAKPAKPPAEWEQLLEVPRSGKELVGESRVAFEELLESLEDIGMLECSDMVPLTDFLASSADEPAAKNVSRLVEWLSGCSVSDSAWKAITALICDKIGLASLDDKELLEIVRALPGVLDWERDDSARRRLHETYATFAAKIDDQTLSGQLTLQAMFEEVYRTTQDAQACSELIAMLIKSTSNCNLQVLSANVASTLLAVHNSGAEDLIRTELLSQLATVLSQVPRAATAEVLRLATRAILDTGPSAWRPKSLRALAWLDCVSPAIFRLDHMPIVYAEVAQRLPLHQIAEHFAPKHIQPVYIARMLLRVWLPNAGFGNTPRSQFESSNAANSVRSLKTVQYGICPPSIADLSAVAVEFDELYEASPKDNVWSAVLKAFKRTGFSYDHIVDQILYICKVRYEPGTIYGIFMYMLKDCELALPTKVYAQLIEHFLDNNENRLAFATWNASPSIALSDVPDLPVALLKDTSFHFDMFEMLLRQPNKVAMEARETQKLSVTPGHSEVVHIIAHNVAKLEELRPSQAYRRVWALYRWLQDRGARVEPLISRAIVTAGIIRPIKEHIWIPNERLDYILSIVEKVEGERIREEVEQLATYMRSSVHDKVMAKRWAKKETTWMRVSRDLVARSRFRLKRWTKQQPVPIRGGKSFAVPSATDGSKNFFVRRFGFVDMKTSIPATGFDDFDDIDDALSTPAITTYRPVREGTGAETVLPTPTATLAAPPSGEDSAHTQDVLAKPADQPVLWRPMGQASEAEPSSPSLAVEHQTQTAEASDWEDMFIETPAARR